MNRFEHASLTHRNGDLTHTIRTAIFPDGPRYVALIDLASGLGISVKKAKQLLESKGRVPYRIAFKGTSSAWGVNAGDAEVFLRDAECDPAFWDFHAWASTKLIAFLKGECGPDEESADPGPEPRETGPGSAMQVFSFKGHEVRTVDGQDGEPWWVAADVCGVLGIRKERVSEAIGRLDPDEKGNDSIVTPGGPQQMTVISESGLYSLILTSRKPEAKAFKKWVTSEVLPTLRKTGRYEMGNGDRQPSTPNTTEVLLQAIVGLLQRQDSRLGELENQVTKLNQITLLPLLVIPKGWHLVRTWAHDHGIDLTDHEKKVEGGRLSHICELHGIEPLGYQRKEGHMVVHLYPTDMCKLWENGWRRQNPPPTMILLPFP